MTPFDFPEAVDSSIMTTFKACPRQAWFAHVRRVRAIGESVHLVAGGAFAKAIERARKLWYVEGCRDEQKIEIEALRTLWSHYPSTTPIPDRYRAKSQLVLAEGLVKYLQHFAFRYDIMQPAMLGDRHGIEFTFSLPLPIKNPQTGDPIFYAGRLDAIMERANILLALDDKTAGGIGPSWSDNWRMRYQFLGYVWACRQLGLPVEGIVVRGLGLTLSKIEVVQDIKFFPKFKIERWHEQMLRDVQRLADSWKTNTWDYDFSQACTSYSGCPFVDPCDNADHEDGIASGHYTKNEWSPLVQIKEL